VTVTAGGGITAGAPRTARRARLQLRRIDPWSTLRFSFVASLALLVVFLVAVIVLYAVLSGMHVFSTINDQLQSLTDNGTTDTTTGLQFDFSFARVLGLSLLIGAVNVVLFTALATLGAFVYNLVADLVGGIEVTLSERD
jgi:ABC-type glycerol-3-phosphate transport system permease component